MKPPATAIRAKGLTPKVTTRVMVAVLDGARYTSDIARRSGMSANCAHRALHELRNLGLVGFTDNLQGTIHPTVEVIEPRSH